MPIRAKVLNLAHMGRRPRFFNAGNAGLPFDRLRSGRLYGLSAVGYRSPGRAREMSLSATA